MAGESPAAILFDIEGNPIGVQSENNTLFLTTKDDELRDVLKQLLQEQRKTNMYLSAILEVEF